MSNRSPLLRNNLSVYAVCLLKALVRSLQFYTSCPTTSNAAPALARNPSEHVPPFPSELHASGREGKAAVGCACLPWPRFGEAASGVARPLGQADTAQAPCAGIPCTQHWRITPGADGFGAADANTIGDELLPD